jgi:transposase
LATNQLPSGLPPAPLGQGEAIQRNAHGETTSINVNKRKYELVNLLSFTNVYFSESSPCDGLRKKPASLREPSGKASGGQAGRKGDTLKRVDDPDRIVVYEARACRHCGAGLRLSMAQDTETRQVFDLPAKLIEITEHRRFVYACAGCGGRTEAAFPDGVEAPAHYGEPLTRGGALTPSAAVDR